MKNRVDIKDFILQIESNFPVNNWKINDVHVWPIIRIRLFFYLINHLENQVNIFENKSTSKKNYFFVKVKKKLIKVIKRYINFVNYLIWKNNLPQKDYLFVGSDSHRVDYRNSRFNRYFDVIIENENISNNSIYFEYSNPLKNQYQKQNIYKFERALRGYYNFYKFKKEDHFNFDGYDDFLSFLENEKVFNSFISVNNKKQLLSWFNRYFIFKISFFKDTLKKVKPKQIVILCYYSDDIFALIVAANQLNIKTFEMQHGPQTDIHLSYGSWSVIPNEGYDVLPRNFWCWDEYSKNVIEKWSSKNNLYKVQIIGNPWVNYWKNKNESYFEKDFVLYSLQPNPITLNQLFTKQIIQTIKQSNEKWFIRLHPRQINEINVIKNLLHKEEILNKVNIDNATFDALPQLLANAKIHITHSSGSALEASFFGLKTILINEIGLKSFPHLIENKSATFIDYKDPDFYFKMKKEMNNEI